jgi:hypothetical protein
VSRRWAKANGDIACPVPMTQQLMTGRSQPECAYGGCRRHAGTSPRGSSLTSPRNHRAGTPGCARGTWNTRFDRFCGACTLRALILNANSMGMDVYGKMPSANSGEYFRASVWEWGAIHNLIVQLCSDVFDAETLFYLGFNDGAGPDDSRACEKMAARFSDWLQHHPSGHAVDLGIGIDADGRLVTSRDESTDITPAHSISQARLQAWAEFLQRCGGFEVW